MIPLNSVIPAHIEERTIRISRQVLILAALVALISLLLDYGFYLSPVTRLTLEFIDVLVGMIFLTDLLVQLIVRRQRWHYVRTNLVKYVLGALLVIQFVMIDLLLYKPIFPELYLLFKPVYLTKLYLVVIQFYIVGNLIFGFIKLNQRITQIGVSPAQFMLTGFGGLILIGTGLLMLPKATTGSIRLIDAFFTATSAVCVTGLIVVDTATAFTRFGQLIILGLIQIGGLGIMTITSFFTLIFGLRLSGRERVLLRDVISVENLSMLGSMLRMIILTTFAIELAGTFFLYWSWVAVLPPTEALYVAMFHAISAFCNAGFSTFSDSLMSTVSHVPVNGVVCLLIITGGLGFGTLRNLGEVFFRSPSYTTPQLKVQTRLVLLISAILLVSGACLFFALEYHYSLANLSTGEKIIASVFQSVTFRTAGFNTVDFAHLHDSTLVLGMMLMFIGGAPGSTAGGIKVTTIGILIATVISASQGKTRLELFRRTIPNTVLYQALVVITMYLAIVMSVSFLLTVTEHHIRPIQLMFETVSAVGTVGLSTGITAQLSTFGKLLITLTMFLGRVGPFTLALAIGQKHVIETYQYPSEGVQIG